MAVIGELDSIHWFCQPCEIEVFRVINESGKSADSAVSTDSMSTSQECQQAVHAISEVMKNLDKIVIEAKEKINSIAKSCQIVPHLSDTTSQMQPDVVHTDRITSENMAMKIVDEYRDRESRKLNLIFHNVPESSAAQQSERVSEDVKFVTNIAKDIGVKEFDLVNSVRLGSQLPNKLRLLRVKLATVNQKREFLNNAKRLKSSSTSLFQKVYITPDLSAQERVVQKQLRIELKRRKENGERNLRIYRGRIVEKPAAPMDTTERVAPATSKDGSNG